MADEKTIQECCKDAMLHMGREKEKLRTMLKMLDGKEELHLDEMELAGLRFLLEDAVEAMECLLAAQCALAAVNAQVAAEAASEAVETAKQAKSPTDYGAVPGRDC